MTEAVNVSSMCSGGLMPVVGGVLDQSPWFLHLHQVLQNDEARIQKDKLERMTRGRGR